MSDQWNKEAQDALRRRQELNKPWTETKSPSQTISSGAIRLNTSAFLCNYTEDGDDWL